MDFSIMFWGECGRMDDVPAAYDAVLEIARYADRGGYSAVWLPERHFHSWGGLHPNPAVLGAAIATMTSTIRIRAGSVVLPLHHPLRVVEEWAVVDNLSRGRVELSVASGWKEDDFVLAPTKYETRKKDTLAALDMVRRLWRGEPYEGTNGVGAPVRVPVFPKPVQREVPIWVTSGGSLRTMVQAGGGGLNLLTHLLGQTFEEVGNKVQQYNAYRARAGLREPGKVALMLHTFLATDREKAREAVRESMSSYLLNSADLSVPASYRQQWRTTDETQLAQMIEIAFDRYFETASLMGTIESCRTVVERARSLGVTEICCLVDFGLPAAPVMSSLELLSELKQLFAGGTTSN